MAASQFYSLTVASLAPETENAVRVSLRVPEELKEVFSYRQGQYLTLRSIVDGEAVQRSYSICSSLADKCLQVAVKRVPGGVFSNFVNESIRVGDSIEVMPPQGSFYTHLSPDKQRNYLFIAAGSGITPVISNIKTLLEEEPSSSVTLLFGNSLVSTIMFRESLSFLKNRYLTRFHWVNILSREDSGIDLLNGHLNNRKGGELGRRLIDLKGYDDYFICGPESMISEVSKGLRSVGVKEARIHYELFASSAADASAVIQKHQKRAQTYGGNVSRVKVILDGRTRSFELTTDGENILDAGIHHGLDLPYSCKGGICSTCKARLVEGEVDMDITHGLNSEEISQGFILTCQSHPLSDSVVVDFDDR